MKKEIWKDYPGFEGRYQISTYGRVRSLNFHREKRESLLSPIIDKGGYEIVKLCKDGIVYPHRVHLMVANTFIPNLEHKPFIDHIDTNRRNNCVWNLRWCTMKENHNNKISLVNHANATSAEWKKGSHDSHKKPVRQYTKSGMFVREYESIAKAAHFFNRPANTIGLCVRRPKSNHSAFGFLWCYADDTERIKEIESLKAQDSSPKLF